MINLIETKRLKEAIESNPSDVLNIIEKTDLAICITNMTGHFVKVNSKYLELYGYKPEEIEGVHFSVLLPKEIVDPMSKVHDRFMKEKYAIIRNWSVMRKDKKPMNIQADAGYTEKIFDKKPYKVTFVKFMGHP
jgi:PAS domain S-box-containing protein